MGQIVLGLDIGGANLKAALSSGASRSQRFDFPDAAETLAGELQYLTRDWRFDRVVVTMTAELCRCFASKREGVQFILTRIGELARDKPVLVWGLDGRFHPPNGIADPMMFAASNWLALATYFARWIPRGPGVLIDVGSTTTDVVPIFDGQPMPIGRSDSARMHSMELIYTGVRATPICALLGWQVMAETFATSHDANLLLGYLPEEPTNYDTADQRPATREFAHARLTRMLGGDSASIGAETTRLLAETAFTEQRRRLAESILWHGREGTQIICGTGEFLARAACDSRRPIRSVAEELGTDISKAACAYAVAQLAVEQEANS